MFFNFVRAGERLQLPLAIDKRATDDQPRGNRRSRHRDVFSLTHLSVTWLLLLSFQPMLMRSFLSIGGKSEGPTVLQSISTRVLREEDRVASPYVKGKDLAFLTPA
jgi:hypothetical protein